tara:strand:+ start:1210 stop:1632 length:423 start_codon:yes stop_codon:yes gene_type:complete
MTKEWYEEDSDDHVWWKATQKNAHAICPSWFEEQIGFSHTIKDEVKFMSGLVATSGGAKMASSIAYGAGKSIEKAAWLGLATHIWCSEAYIVGGLDAMYQMHHDGSHIGLALWDSVSDWYVTKEKGVDNFFHKLEHWWEH